MSATWSLFYAPTVLGDALQFAIQARLEQVEKRKAQPHVPMSWITLPCKCAKLPRRDQRSVDQIIGYDKSGLPT